ncbi:nitric oxide reductase activation protein NorD [Hydrogenophaga sp.]|uniref:nitric oxide reductase activation protein NorD n=1 Tax=Hydrogenophaga sp. TaxID=1904254 RepID=UPI003D0DBE18
MSTEPLAQMANLARALWGQPWRTETMPQARGEGARPVITRDGDGPHVLHLPPALPAIARDHALAVAAHAAAHARFGGPPQSRAGLKQVQQALLGVLEDARVEWLALQELPGLRAVWWPYHCGPGALRGSGFEDLLARLSACLLAPAHADPHPWIARVKSMFFAADGHTLALRTPGDVRAAASRLGHDIGQMRLPFNARTYAVHATCRDDNSHLWLPDASLPPSDAVLSGDAGPVREGGAAADAHPEAPGPGNEAPVARHPEWDHRIRRYRPDWCSVHTRAPPFADRIHMPGVAGPARRLAARLAGLQGPLQRMGGRAATGEDLHPAALVDTGLDLRARRAPDPRVYRRQGRPCSPLAVLLLLDASASTRGAASEQMQQAAATAALALQRIGHRTALWAFSSEGRHQVRMPCLKGWDDTMARAALPVLRGEASTRMGAALRHALQLQASDARRHPAHRRVVVLFTDDELHDIDVHDPGYLPADLQRAGHEALRQGVAVRGLVFSPGAPEVLARALGHGTLVRQAGELPGALARVLSRQAP